MTDIWWLISVDINIVKKWLGTAFESKLRLEQVFNSAVRYTERLPTEREILTWHELLYGTRYNRRTLRHSLGPTITTAVYYSRYWTTNARVVTVCYGTVLRLFRPFPSPPPVSSDCSWAVFRGMIFTDRRQLWTRTTGPLADGNWAGPTQTRRLISL